MDFLILQKNELKQKVKIKPINFSIYGHERLLLTILLHTVYT